jgi:hypothetical protein
MIQVIAGMVFLGANSLRVSERIGRNNVDLLKEAKQVQLQILDQQAYLGKTPTGPRQQPT